MGLLPTHQGEPKADATPTLREIWKSTRRIPGCSHDPPCKVSRWYLVLFVGRAFCLVTLRSVAQSFVDAMYVLGFVGHFHLAIIFAHATVDHLQWDHPTYSLLCYWPITIAFLVITLFSLRSYEHLRRLKELKIGGASVMPTILLRLIKLIIPALFTVIFVFAHQKNATSMTSRFPGLAFVPVGISILLGYNARAYKWEKWQFRRSLGELVKGRLREELEELDSLVTQELDDEEDHLAFRKFEKEYGLDFRRCNILMLFGLHLHYIYVNIAQMFQTHIDDLVWTNPGVHSRTSLWLRQLIYWSIAIHTFTTLVRVVANNGPISCFGKRIDRNLLRLLVVIPSLIMICVPGGLGNSWKSVVLWALSLMPCILIGLGAGALKILRSPLLLYVGALLWLATLSTRFST